MRPLFATVLLFFLSSPSFADVPLSLHGDVVQVVKSMPFTVSAPKGSCVYIWGYGRDVSAVEQKNKLQITSAPKGKLVITIKCIQVDWEAKKLTEDFGSLTFLVGELPSPGPGPQPEPEPVAPLVQVLREAYAMEPAATRAADVAKLTHLFEGAETVINNKSLSKVYEVNQVLKAARVQVIGDRLPLMRGVLSADSNETLPTDPQASLAEHRQLLLRTYERYVAALRQVQGK